MALDVVVVGSLNQDLIVHAPKIPQPGETVLGHGHSRSLGGKGANQAVAAARLGRAVGMVGRVGADDAGRELVSALTREGIDVSSVAVDESAPTGMALITLADDAENSIVVSPGANSFLSLADVEASRETIERAGVVLLQLEVPLEVVTEAARLAGGTVILNPAPAQDLPDELLAAIDFLVPNRAELEILEGSIEPASAADVVGAWESIGVEATLIVTMGGEGAALVEDGELTVVEAPEVTPVDTVGAGDAFCGALADALSRGVTLMDAVRWAVTAGALATTKPGAQAAMPTRTEVETLLES